ncbi:hypothetical protein MRY87_09885 [bacterium]|nr:hypothetical protein [bacterium]
MEFEQQSREERGPGEALDERSPAGSYHNPFGSLLATGFCTAEELRQIQEDYRDCTEAHFLLIDICTKQRGRFPLCAPCPQEVMTAPKEGRRESVVAALQATVSLDPQVFDFCWSLFRSEGRKGHEYGKSAQHTVDRVVQLFERLRGCGEHWSPSESNYELVEIVLTESREPTTDLHIIRNRDPDRCHLTPHQLRQYYREGHRFIPSYDFFDRKLPPVGEGSGHSSSDLLSRKFAQMDSYPSLEQQDDFVRRIGAMPEEIESALSALFPRFEEIEDEWHSAEAVLSLVEKCGLDISMIVQILSALEHSSPENFGFGVALLRRIAGRDSVNLGGYGELLAEGDYSGVEQRQYRQCLEEHQARFPEKPLDKVQRDFQLKMGSDGEPVPAPLLERTINQYKRITAIGEPLVSLSPEEIIESIERLSEVRERLEAEEVRLQFFAHIRELFKREFGVYAHNTQMIAVELLTDPESLLLSDGEVARGVYEQVKTGEGKSIIVALAAAYYGFVGRTVHVATIDSSLAVRDMKKFESFFAKIGLDTALYDSVDGEEPERATILFASLESLIFGFLHAGLDGKEFLGGDFDVILVDEADRLCLEMKMEPCRICRPGARPFSDGEMTSILELTTSFSADAIREDLPSVIAEMKVQNSGFRERDPLLLGLYIRSAALARTLEEGVDYVIEDNAVVIIDRNSTERLRRESVWDNGLHEFVALRHHLPLPQYYAVAAQMSPPTFLGKYATLHCLSGTIGDGADRQELRARYGLVGFDIPSHALSRRIDLPFSVIDARSDWEALLLHRIQQVAGSDLPQPVLLVMDTVAESKHWDSLLRRAGLSCQLLNDYENRGLNGDPKESEGGILAEAGRPGVVTISTQMVGRGADILLDQEVQRNGGLHVIGTFVPANLSLERQIRGRSGRQGDSGSSEFIICAETDRYLASLQEEICAALLNIYRAFGHGSSEFERTINFVRKGTHLWNVVSQRAVLEQEELVLEILERYFDVLRIATSESAQGEGEGTQSLGVDLVQAFLYEEWAGAYEDIGRIVEHGDLLFTGTWEDLILRDSLPSSAEELADAFRKEVEIHLEEARFGEDQFREMVEPIFRGLLSDILYLEARLASLDKKALDQLLVALKTRVDSLVGECFTGFGGVDVRKIQGYRSEDDSSH